MKKSHWSVAEAKARLSTVLRQAETAPQVVESRGKAVAVVLGIEDFAKVGDPADATLGGARWRRFLELSAALRQQGGGTLRPTKRTPRPSPFSAR